MTKEEFIKKVRRLFVESTNKHGYVDITDAAIEEIIEGIKDQLLPFEVSTNEET
jgi:hypothetical protein